VTIVAPPAGPAVAQYPLEVCDPPFVSLFAAMPADLVQLWPELPKELVALPRFASDVPLYGSIRFATPACAIETRLALDESGGMGAGYDRVFVDTDADGDLAEEAPVDLQTAPAVDQRRGVPSSDPHADLALADGSSIRVYFAVTDLIRVPGSGVSATTMLPEQRVALAARAPQARTATVTVGAMQTSVIVVDNDGDGRFRDRLDSGFLFSNASGLRAPDLLCVDVDGNGAIDVNLETLHPGELLVGNTLAAASTCVSFDVSADGSTITVSRRPEALAAMSVPGDARVNAVLTSAGAPDLDLVAFPMAGEGLWLPAASYSIPLCRMAEPDSQGRTWVLVGGEVQWFSLGGSTDPVQVAPGTASLPFGPPLSISVDCAVYARDVYLTPHVTDASGRYWALLVDGKSPGQVPTFRILGPDGQPVGSGGTFTVRDGLPQRVVWHGPQEAPAGAYEVRASWGAGAFEWTDRGASGLFALE